VVQIKQHNTTTQPQQRNAANATLPVDLIINSVDSKKTWTVLVSGSSELKFIIILAKEGQ
jgi:hypothetical protein